MANKNSNESPESAIEKSVLDGLVSFFGNPDNFDRIVLSARCRTEQLAKKLDSITDRLVEVDARMADLLAKVAGILRKVSAGKIADDAGGAMLMFIEDQRQRLREERSELEVKETQLCKQVHALERFGESIPWCYLHVDELGAEDKRDVVKWIVDRVEVYVRMP